MAHELVVPATPQLARLASLDGQEDWQARVDLAACLCMAARQGLEKVLQSLLYCGPRSPRSFPGQRVRLGF